MKRTHYSLAALILGVAWIAAASLILKAVGSSESAAWLAKSFFDMQPADSPSGVLPYPLSIQNLMWLIFFVGLGELAYRLRQGLTALRSIASGLLPEEDDVVLVRADLNEYYRKLKDKSGLLPELILSLVLRFQASQSVSETHAMLNSQLEHLQVRIDIDYSMTRYIAWLIPTLGFIGTVIGISQALDFASNTDPAAANFLSGLVSALGVAFYTTLLALIQSAILVYCMHVIQAMEERSIVLSGQYCLKNLINKLYQE